MPQVKVIVTVRQGRALPIVGLSCSLSDQADAGQLGVTDSEGTISGHFPGGSKVRFSVWSKKRNASKYIGTLQLGPDSIPEQHFTAVVDLIKLEAQTQPHPPDSQEVVYPALKLPKQPTNRSPEGSNKLHPQGTPTTAGRDAQGNPEIRVDAQNATMISLAQMQKMWPAVRTTKRAQLQEIADELNKNLEKYKLDTPLRKAHFFAQVMKEAGPSLELDESLFYSRKAAEMAFKRIANPPYSNALKYCKPNVNQVEFGNWIYAYQNGNGDYSSGDGYRYKGRGLIHLTGRKNYLSFEGSYQKIFGENPPGSFVDDPDLVAKFTKYSTRAAIYFWISSGAFLDAIDESNKSIKLVTKKINGGENGLPDRVLNFSLTWAIFR